MAVHGDGDVPHPAVGRARRMQVAKPTLQHEVMIEAVENHNPEVIVIDEIGPMELRGEGFDQILKEILEKRNGTQTVLLVVRDGLAEEVKEKYKIENRIVIGSVAALQA